LVVLSSQTPPQASLVVHETPTLGPPEQAPQVHTPSMPCAGGGGGGAGGPPLLGSTQLPPNHTHPDVPLQSLAFKPTQFGCDHTAPGAV